MNTEPALNDLAARHLGGPPGDLRAACPLCARKKNDDAVAVTVKDDGSVVAYCHRCNLSGAARPDNGHRRPAQKTVKRTTTDHRALWEAASEPGEAFEHAYLTRKQVGTHGIRAKDDLLLVPMRNASGELVGVQTIDANGDKLNTKGAKKTGAYHLIGEPAGRIIIAEGYATAAMIYEATEIPTVVAFDCENLVPVAKALREKDPTAEIIIAADDDFRTKGNPGITHATEAARAIGARLAIAEFGDSRPDDATDFNDLALLRGADAVREGIAKASSIESDTALEYAFADELGESGDEVDEVVEQLLARGGMSIEYGDSNSGKTFSAIDITCAVARGIPWMGRNVEPGMVVYLASESPASVRRRLRAYQRHHGCKVPNFAIVRSPIDLYNGGDDTDKVIDLVRKLEAWRGVKCALVVGDTLSRLSAGANENSGEDMSIVVRHVDKIRREAGVHFMLIHHTGKNAALGMRGWSGMRAATDTEIEITVDDDTGIHAAEITKQRDIPGKGERIGFRLQVVEMGIGKWGKAITSCVVVSADAPAKKSAGKRPSEIGGAITEFLSVRGAGIKRAELVDHFEGRYRRTSVYREIAKMIEARMLTEAVGIVALCKA